MISRAASAIWSGLSAAARESARRGWLESTRLEGVGRVISVGNLQAGGAGKTPLVAQIAREAAERGLSVCILCRGYGAAWENSGGMIAPGGRDPDPLLCGDEAVLLHDLAPSATISIGANRAGQFEKTRSRSPGKRFDVAILDDGFQHHRLRRDVEIVALTSATRGERVFRDSEAALRHADLVVWTKGDRRPDARGKPLVKVRYRLAPGDSTQRYWLVTGLADGEFAVRSAREAGYRIERHVAFADHARYEERGARGILREAGKQGCGVALTGKDWVKWRALGIPSDTVSVLEPELTFEEGKELWSRTLWAE